MNTSNKRMNKMDSNQNTKRMKKECSYGESCYRMNPAHFREFSHPHLEEIIDTYVGTGDYNIPDKYSLQRNMIVDQLNVIVEKKLHEPKQNMQTGQPQNNNQSNSDSAQSSQDSSKQVSQNTNSVASTNKQKVIVSKGTNETQCKNKDVKSETAKCREQCDRLSAGNSNTVKSRSPTPGMGARIRDSDYRPIVQPTRRAADYFKVVVASGGMRAKHTASAPYYVFYTTISAARETHQQPYSITFQEILDSSLGELQSSLQISFMVEAGWLLAHYYFAGYSAKKLTILYGEECSELQDISKKKPNVEALRVQMATPFGKHHTKMMLLCYEDGSLRVVVSTANLYLDDWENRTQGLWFSPRCPELPQGAMPHEGESPTQFKRDLLRYLAHYRLPQLAFYLERVKRCDFGHINVFLVASVPGSHFDLDWGMSRAGALLRQHCAIPASQQRDWPLVAQASSLGSYGAEPKKQLLFHNDRDTLIRELFQLWLTGDFLHHFTKIKSQPQTLSQPPPIKLIYPSLENVKQSHDGLLGGGCLPYAADVHVKQPWLNDFLYQWIARSSCRHRAMPHIKSYLRPSPDNTMAAYYLLTSANVSKAAWGVKNKGNGALRIMSYEAGVLLLPRLMINEDFFPLQPGAANRLIIPYDLPPLKYTSDMSPWVSDHLY